MGQDMYLTEHLDSEVMDMIIANHHFNVCNLDGKRFQDWKRSDQVAYIQSAESLFEIINSVGICKDMDLDDKVHNLLTHADKIYSMTNPDYTKGTVLNQAPQFLDALTQRFEKGQCLLENLYENGLKGVLLEGRQIDVRSNTPRYCLETFNDMFGDKLQGIEEINELGRYIPPIIIPSAEVVAYIDNGSATISDLYRWTGRCVSEATLEEYAGRFATVEWARISSEQPLSKKFIERHADKLDIGGLRANRHLDKDTAGFVHSPEGYACLTGKKLSSYGKWAQFTFNEISDIIDMVKSTVNAITHNFVHERDSKRMVRGS